MQIGAGPCGPLRTVLCRRPAPRCDTLASMNPSSAFIQVSAKMQEVFERAEKAAHSDTTVLLTGETGTGKTIIADWIHGRSERKGKLVTFNCAAGEGNVVLATFFGHMKGTFTDA